MATTKCFKCTGESNVSIISLAQPFTEKWGTIYTLEDMFSCYTSYKYIKFWSIRVFPASFVKLETSFPQYFCTLFHALQLFQRKKEKYQHGDPMCNTVRIVHHSEVLNTTGATLARNILSIQVVIFFLLTKPVSMRIQVLQSSFIRVRDKAYEADQRFISHHLLTQSKGRIGPSR